MSPRAFVLAPYHAGQHVAGHRPSLLRWLGRVLSTRRQRHALSELDAHLLRDIGKTRDEAHTETSRSAFDLPR